MTDGADDFLSYLDREARKRLAARQGSKAPPCSACNGTGSVTRYVLPGVTGPDKCKRCGGTGDAPNTPAAVIDAPALKVKCPDCDAEPGKRCLNRRYASPIPLGSWSFVRPHKGRQRAAREEFGNGVDT